MFNSLNQRPECISYHPGIPANDLTTKGIKVIEQALQHQEHAYISEHGVGKYVVMTVEHHQYLRECELDSAVAQSRADIAAGRYVKESVADHLARLDAQIQSSGGCQNSFLYVKSDKQINFGCYSIHLMTHPLFSKPPYAVEHSLKTLGNNLRTARLRRNLSMQEVAEKIGVQRHAIASAEQGKPSTGIAVYVAILWVLGLVDQVQDLANPDLDEHGKILARSRERRNASRPRELDDDF